MSSVCPFPSTPATPRISPGATASETRSTTGRLHGEIDVPAHHRLRDLARARRARRHPRDGAPVLHHRHAVAHRHHLVELVRDEHDRAPLVAQRAQHRPQLLHLGRGEHGGRLVEDQRLRAAVERLEDLDPLRLAHRQLGHEAVGGDGEPRARAERLDLAHRPRAVERRPPRELAAQHHVLGHREARDEHEVLVHHADAGVDRRRGGPAGDVPAAHAHGAAVGRVESGEDAHERGLARAVLPHQRVDLAARHLQRRPAVGVYGAEVLVDVGNFDGQRCRHRVLGTWILPATISDRSCSRRACTAGGMSARLFASYT
jgi:hypothetical protein